MNLGSLSGAAGTLVKNKRFHIAWLVVLASAIAAGISGLWSVYVLAGLAALGWGIAVVGNLYHGTDQMAALIRFSTWTAVRNDWLLRTMARSMGAFVALFGAILLVAGIVRA